MTYTEQELACLHAEALLVQQRLELMAGLQEAADKATAAQQQMMQAAVRRDQQSNIYGMRTLKDKRVDEAAIKEAGKKPAANLVCLIWQGPVASDHHRGTLLVYMSTDSTESIEGGCVKACSA
jgi:hypothetical protein